MVLRVRSFDVVYPEGCTEIEGSLRPDELRKRINVCDIFGLLSKDINAALRTIVRQTGLPDESLEEEESENRQAVNEAQKPIQLTGLLFHLLSSQFTHHSDVDIRLRICVAVCRLLKLFCPTNPFETLPDSQSRIKTCCKLDVFTWCRLLDDGDKYLLECLKTLLGITRNLSIWAWSDEAAVQQFILNTLVTLIQQSSAILTDEVVAYLLSFLIEPSKSSQPLQHSLVKDLILRTATQLEYPIQMLIQNSLVTSDQKGEISLPDQSDCDFHSRDPLGEHSFVIIYALHTLKESLVSPILPCIGLKLKSSVARERKRAFRLLTRIFSEPSSTVHHKNPDLWETFLTRFHDIDPDVRNFCIQMVPIMLKQNPVLPRNNLIDCLKSCTIDRVESVRLLALKVVATLMRESKDGDADALFDIISNRSRDKSLPVRKEVLSEMAQVYKQNLQVTNPNYEKMTTALNAIMHMYYQPTNDDKIIVERLFKSCIVPYNFGTKDRVKSLFTCYQLADDASIKAIQELLKIQFTGCTLMREALRIIVENPGKKLAARASGKMMQILNKLSSLLPKSEKALDHLKKFFNTVLTDRALRTNCCQLFHLNCPSKLAAQTMHNVLKRVAGQAQHFSSGGGGGDGAHYEHAVKLLLERCASVLFDEAFGQELLTRLVVSMETNTSDESIEVPSGSAELVRGLRILLALSVYHRDALPSDDMFQYVNSVLVAHMSSSVCDMPAKSASEEDPSTPVELCLQVLCCLLGGGPIYGPKDAGGSGAALDQHAVDLQAALTSADEGEKRSKGAKLAAKRSCNAHLYSGSQEQLHQQALEILPLLTTFCTTGLTADCPPVPPETPSAAKQKRKRREKEHAKGDSSNETVTVYKAGLAWRQEKRRTKLAVRVLRQLLSVVHALAGKSSTFPKGPVSSLDAQQAEEEASTAKADGDCNFGEMEDKKTETATSITEDDSANETESSCSDASRMAELEIKVQHTLDDIVKTCLACEPTSSDYIACLTCLSHVALLFPGVYNRQMKALMTGHLIPNLITKDEDKPTPSSSTKRGGFRKRKKEKPDDTEDTTSPSDWTLDGNVPLLTRAKAGLKLQNKQVAQVIIRLLHRIIVHDGDLTCNGLMTFGDMSRMRLAAATSWLKIARVQFYAEVIEVGWYQSMSYVMCDPCTNVRSHFLNVLHQGLIQLKLPLEYIGMFVHAADVPEPVFRQRAKQYLTDNIKRRRDFIARHGSFEENPKLLFAILPDFVLAYAIHLLAHDPDWEKPEDVARLSAVKAALWFIMEPIMAGGNNYTFLRQLLEKIKHSQDALRPDDEVANTKIYIACDISLGLLLTRCTNIVWKGCQFEIKLPRTLFLRAPPSFSNPDFAQLCNESTGGVPLITFTPTKNAKAVKDGLIPPKFLRVKATAHKRAACASEATNLTPKSPPVDEEEADNTRESTTASGADLDVDLDKHGGNDAAVQPQTSSDQPEEQDSSPLLGKRRRKRESETEEVTSKRPKTVLNYSNAATEAQHTETKKPAGLKQAKLPFTKKGGSASRCQTRASSRTSPAASSSSRHTRKPT
ncbi:unnamed protein product [Mesocestoides corti]|uniref:Sister chromatid cohesion protein n=1 Tax=Mesocestoides corti TaxID=53468 RepID=A0A0R3UIB9_MESCO|nr:unnamed protein product [Mesocestoides corti]